MESKPAAPSRSPAGPARSPGPRRRGRRGGRGRRRPAPVTPVAGQPAQPELPAEQIEPPIRVHEMPVRPAPSKHRTQPPVPEAAHAPVSAPVSTPVSAPVSAPISARVPTRVSAPPPAARAAKPEDSIIGRTVDEVRQIVESLEQAVEQMEEVLRMVELAEHQKFDDERELESLRRALHKLQPPHRERREEGH